MLARRLLTIPAYLVLWLAWIALLPVWLPLAAIVDVARRSGGVALRSAGVVSVYLTCEALGIAVSAALWLWGRLSRPTVEDWQDVHFRLEAWWGATLFRAVVRLFGMRLEVEDDADAGRGPYLLLVRHASTVDSLLTSALISQPHEHRVRYVLKRELLWDPCLDIVGNRVPNAFLDRGAEDSAREIERIAALARDLGARDGLLIHPEGTRFSEQKRRRIVERLEREGRTQLLEYARSLKSVLPPRPAGTLALLEASPQADVVFCAHTGFEGSASLAAIWNGALLHRTVRVKLTRVPRTEIPAQRDDVLDWLLEEWRRIDAWVSANGSS